MNLIIFIAFLILLSIPLLVTWYASNKFGYKLGDVFKLKKTPSWENQEYVVTKIDYDNCYVQLRLKDTIRITRSFYEMNTEYEYQDNDSKASGQR